MSALATPFVSSIRNTDNPVVNAEEVRSFAKVNVPKRSVSAVEGDAAGEEFTIVFGMSISDHPDIVWTYDNFTDRNDDFDSLLTILSTPTA